MTGHPKFSPLRAPGRPENFLGQFAGFVTYRQEKICYNKMYLILFAAAAVYGGGREEL